MAQIPQNPFKDFKYIRPGFSIHRQTDDTNSTIPAKDSYIAKLPQGATFIPQERNATTGEIGLLEIPKPRGLRGIRWNNAMKTIAKWFGDKGFNNLRAFSSWLKVDLHPAKIHVHTLDQAALKREYSHENKLPHGLPSNATKILKSTHFIDGIGHVHRFDWMEGQNHKTFFKFEPLNMDDKHSSLKVDPSTGLLTQKNFYGEGLLLPRQCPEKIELPAAFKHDEFFLDKLK